MDRHYTLIDGLTADLHAIRIHIHERERRIHCGLADAWDGSHAIEQLSEEQRATFRRGITRVRERDAKHQSAIGRKRHGYALHRYQGANHQACEHQQSKRESNLCDDEAAEQSTLRTAVGRAKAVQDRGQPGSRTVPGRHGAKDQDSPKRDSQRREQDGHIHDDDGLVGNRVGGDNAQNCL